MTGRASAAVVIALLLAACGSGERSRSVAGNSSSVTGTRSISVDTSDASIPAALRAGVRPIGRGPRFHPGLSTRAVAGCDTRFGNRFHAHIELFGANKVVLLAAGIGTQPPRQISDGSVTAAGCFGPVVTLDPTGVLYVRSGARPTLGLLFRTWGQTLTAARIASFTGGEVRVYIDGHRVRQTPAAIKITPDAEIVLEVGHYVPPHRQFTYAPMPDPA